MSNFICPVCGLNNIDCGKAGYKTDKELELETENIRLKEVLESCKEFFNEENPKDFTVMAERMDELSNRIDEVLK
mgnify:CR=1 FL=1